MRATSPYTLPPLTDGIHTIAVKAVDNAGWETIGTVQVYIDATPPVAFTPAADPAGWTNNTQPVITFDTTDATSGIDHYELKVRDEAFVTVTSPYTLPAQPDGEHMVTVRAVDRAGNFTDGQVKIFIDTTPPKKPEIVRVIPGKERITVAWKPSVDTDVVRYTIERDPAWPAGPREVAGTEAQILDEDLPPRTTYAYRIVATDHAQNASEPTDWFSAEVALAQVPYIPEQGSVVEYENVALVVPKGALPEDVASVQVAEVVSPQLTEQAAFPIWSPIYEFSVVKQGATEPERGATFDQGVLVRLTYDPAQIPEEFNPQNLGVFYFDEMFGQWFRMPVSAVDVENHNIIFATNHFTSVSIQPVLVKDLSAQEYKDTGISPFKSYVEHSGVTVSPQVGTASTGVTELVLPGRNGFDLVLKRQYDSATARMDAMALDINVGISLGASAVKDVPEVAEKIEELKKLRQTAGYIRGGIDLILNYLYRQGDYAYSMGQGWRLNVPYVLLSI